MRKNLPQAGSIAQKNTTRTSHIIVPDSWWVMTYQGQICQIKDTDQFRDDSHRYRRNGWTSPVTAGSQARKMNLLFHTDAFGILQVAGGDHGSS